MRLGRWNPNNLTRVWATTIPDSGDYTRILAAKGAFVYCQGVNEGYIQKRARSDRRRD